MQTLETKFRKDGFDYALVERRDDKAIYSQSKRGKLISYEAIVIQHHDAHTWPNGDVSPPREGYPNNSLWGKKAWTCASLERCGARLGWPGGALHTIQP